MIRHAELSPVKLDDNAIQYITDSMANNMLIQINYEGSGWRTIQPYSFTTSKDNNLLVMCYKQDGSIRSYRFDRINQLYVDDSLLRHFRLGLHQRRRHGGDRLHADVRRGGLPPPGDQRRRRGRRHARARLQARVH